MSREKQKKSAQKRVSGLLPPWLLVIVCLCYDEGLFCLWTQSQMRPGRILTIAAFTLAFSLLTALAAAIGRSQRFHLILACVICSFWAVFYLTEYFLLDAFKNYFTIGQIFSAGGNAGQEDFSARVWGLLRAGFWRIPVMAAPIIVYAAVNGVTRRERLHTAGVRRYLFVTGVALAAAAGFLSLFVSPDTRKLHEEYSFTEAVNSFGLPTGLMLDLVNSGGGAPSFVIESGFPGGWEPDPQPVPTSPAGTDPSEQTAAPSGTEAPAETGEAPATTEQAPESTAETEPPAPPAPSWNVLDIDFSALAESEPDARIAAVHSYVNSLTPSRTNAMTGRFAGKNLIFITAEAFSKEVIDPELTPTLYRMATKGIHFTDYYQPAWGGSTSTGEFSNLVGIIPTDGVRSIKDTIGHNMYLTIGNQLIRQGYFSRGYHNNSYTYYGRDQTHENLGYEKWIGMGNGMEAGVKNIWPESDREMINFTFPQFVDQQPFSIYYMMVSGHGGYSWGGNSMSNVNREAVAELPYSETVKAYIAANLELEYAMRDLLALLEEAGIADDTVIVLGADHYPYGLDESLTWGDGKNYLPELYGISDKSCFTQDHNALIIWSGCIEDEGLEVITPVYSLDILPTLSNLFGLPYDSRLLVGRDVFSDQKPLTIWINHSWKTDLGSYDASTGVFTPADGADVPDGYADWISAQVRNKFSFSDAVLKYHYYDVLFNE